MLKTGIHTAGTQPIDFQIYVANTTGPKRTEVVSLLVGKPFLLCHNLGVEGWV